MLNYLPKHQMTDDEVWTVSKRTVEETKKQVLMILDPFVNKKVTGVKWTFMMINTLGKVPYLALWQVGKFVFRFGGMLRIRRWTYMSYCLTKGTVYNLKHNWPLIIQHSMSISSKRRDHVQFVGKFPLYLVEIIEFFGTLK